MMSFIMSVLGWILTLLYGIVNNYGVAIILFTVLVKLLLFPMDLKQRRSMAKTQKIQPLLNEVQKKYANDKDKLSQETMKLYQKYGISPMSGCLPMLIQLPIIFALFYVIRKPLIYMVGIDFDETWRVAGAFNAWYADMLKNSPEIINQLPEVLRNLGDAGLTVTKDSNTFGLHEIQVAQAIARFPEILNHPYITEYWQDGIRLINFNFLGMDLSETPSYTAIFGLLAGNIPDVGTMLLWLIPVASGASAFVSSHLTREKQPKADKNIILAENEKPKDNGNGTGDAMKSMVTIMPLFSLVFAFSLPAGIGLYWTISNIIQIVQHIIVKKFFSNDISLEEIEGEMKNVKNRKKRKNAR